MSAVFFFNDTATTEIYTLSLHDALPILDMKSVKYIATVDVKKEEAGLIKASEMLGKNLVIIGRERSEEHTSELQSRQYLVCRLLLEKKKHELTPVLQSAPLLSSPSLSSH